MASEQQVDDISHRRLNLLTGNWVLCSPHRDKRPWLGEIGKTEIEKSLSYDKNCYLCPGNFRSNGTVRNDNFTTTFCFVNDFPALLTPSNLLSSSINDVKNEGNLLISQADFGVCKVLVFSPDHSKTFPNMTIEEIRVVLDSWCKEYDQIFKEFPFIKYIQIFENKGQMMGCSMPHPHCQIWASSVFPNEISLECREMKKWSEQQNSSSCTCLLCSYLELELKKGIRIIFRTETWIILVPFWAFWPFETLMLPRRHVKDILHLSSDEKNDFSACLKEITTRYDNVFQCSFPYSMGIHECTRSQQSIPEKHKDYHDGQTKLDQNSSRYNSDSPILMSNSFLEDDEFSWFHLHVHFYPPLLRSATVKKFSVGYEMFAEPQRDITPEKAAKILQSMSSKHYTNQ